MKERMCERLTTGQKKPKYKPRKRRETTSEVRFKKKTSMPRVQQLTFCAGRSPPDAKLFPCSSGSETLWDREKKNQSSFTYFQFQHEQVRSLTQSSRHTFTLSSCKLCHIYTHRHPFKCTPRLEYTNWLRSAQGRDENYTHSHTAVFFPPSSCPLALLLFFLLSLPALCRDWPSCSSIT